MASLLCTVPAQGRKRVFWTTQPHACGSYSECDDTDCGIPGLQYTAQAGCNTCTCRCLGAEHDPDCLAIQRAEDGKQPVSFATNDWIRSTLLNIFNTVARKDASDCGSPPGAQGGHWSESYMGVAGSYIGTGIFDIDIRLPINTQIALIAARAAKDAQKLVNPYGVATSVSVEHRYKGNTALELNILVAGPHVIDGRINLLTKRMANRWVWA